MKTVALRGILLAVLVVGLGSVVHAQGYGNGYGPGMMRAYVYQNATTTSASTSSSPAADSGEATGALLWQQIASGRVTCSSLSQGDFAALGDYFMSEMMGPYHDQADQYMTQTLGTQGEEAMHIAMGERLSGCNPNAAYPAGANGFAPMMGGWGMFNGGYGPGYGRDSAGGALLGVLIGILASVGSFVLVTWLLRRRRHIGQANAILEARFARGEITKAQFMEMRENLKK